MGTPWAERVVPEPVRRVCKLDDPVAEEDSWLREGGFKQPKLLIVAHEETEVELLKRIVMLGGYQNHRATSDLRKVLSLCREFEPDLLLLDLNMPRPDGLAMIRTLRAELPADSTLLIVILTDPMSRRAKELALSLGANDLVTRPFDATEILLRIGNLLERPSVRIALQNYKRKFHGKVPARTGGLERAQIEILSHLALAAEYRDDNTGSHTRRVGELSALISRGLGQAENQVELIRRAAPLHDIGKIAIPDQILLKPGRLTPVEFAIMKTHTTIGANILGGSRFPLLRLGEEIAISHHESWNGTGYPRGLSGESIPLAGRVVAVADVFDALIHDRPYRQARSIDDGVREIRLQSGHKFDPDVVEAFLSIVDGGSLTRLLAAVELGTNCFASLATVSDE